MYPGNVALTVGKTKVSVGMYNLYYNLMLSNYQQQAQQGTYDIDFTKDLSEQTTIDENDEEITWLDALEQDTLLQLQFVASYYEPALEAGVELTDDQKSNIESTIDNLKTTASEAGQSINKYLAENYGKHCGIETIRKFYEQRSICENYYSQMQIKLSATEEETEKYYEENKDNFVTFAYIENQYTLDGSDKEIKSIDDVKKKTEEYCKQIKTVDDMKKLIPTACTGLIEMAIEQGYFSDEKNAVETLKDSVVVTYDNATVSQNFGEDILNWLKSSDRKEGDVTYYINEDYGYACIFLYSADAKPNETELYSVRHILISPNDDPNTAESATDAEWEAAKIKAETILSEYNNGDKTEISFAELAEKSSADVNTTSSGGAGMYGGELKKIKLGEMVPEFENWATDKSRKYGDVEIVKSKFGYHIMYFIYDGPTYMFNMMDYATTEKNNDFIKSVECKKHLAFKSATVFKPEKETETTGENETETVSAAG